MAPALSWDEFLVLAEEGDVFRFFPEDEIGWPKQVIKYSSTRLVVKYKTMIEDRNLGWESEDADDPCHFCFYESNQSDRIALYEIVKKASTVESKPIKKVDAIGMSIVDLKGPETIKKTALQKYQEEQEMKMLAAKANLHHKIDQSYGYMPSHNSFIDSNGTKWIQNSYGGWAKV